MVMCGHAWSDGELQATQTPMMEGDVTKRDAQTPLACKSKVAVKHMHRYIHIYVHVKVTRTI